MLARSRFSSHVVVKNVTDQVHLIYCFVICFHLCIQFRHFWLKPRATLRHNMAPKKKAAEAVSCTEGRRPLKRRLTEEQVQRALDQHFGDFPPEAKDGKEVNGQNLRAALLTSKRANGPNGRIGAAEIRRLRDLYAPQGSVRHELQMNAALPLHPALDNAMQILNDDNPSRRDRLPLISWMNMAAEVNARELCIIARWVADQNLGTSVVARQITLALMQLIARTDAARTHAFNVNLMKPIFDQCLAATYTALKKEGQKSHTFVAAHAHVIPLVPLGETILAIGAQQGAHDHVHAEIARAVRDSILGNRLYSEELPSIQVKALTAKLNAEAKINRATIFTDATYAALQALGCIM